MTSVESRELPNKALLARYKQLPHFTDCYSIEISGSFSQSQFVQAFYTTWLFKLERRILAWVIHQPSTDIDAKSLADDHTDRFSAWRVEARSDTQLLMADLKGNTRSWLMSRSIDNEPGPATRLYFGSAVLARKKDSDGQARLGAGFRLLLGFHRVYSIALLRAAAGRLQRQAW